MRHPLPVGYAYAMGLRDKINEAIYEQPQAPPVVQANGGSVTAWEYEVRHLREGRTEGLLGAKGIAKEFNELGRMGWELAGITGERAIFKRPC